MPLLLFLVLVSAVFANREFICGQNDPVPELNALGKLMITISHPYVQKLSKREVQFISSYPLRSISMLRETSLAYQHSQLFCEPEWVDKASGARDIGDNEVDAIRHFIFAATLTKSYPQDVFSMLLIHELQGQPFNDQNFMDLHNNREGVKYAEEMIRKNPEISLDELAKLALKRAVEMLKRRELKILQTTKTGFCKDLAIKSEDELKNRIEFHNKFYGIRRWECFNYIKCGMRDPYESSKSFKLKKPQTTP